MKAVIQRGPADCVRACLCAVLGLEPEQLTVGDKPAPEINADRWWVEGSEALRRFGLCLVETSPAYLMQSHLSEVYWIGLVPSHFRDGGHAIVMRGMELVHDPARSEPRYTTESVAEVASRNALCAAMIAMRDPSLMVDLRQAARGASG